MISRPRAYCPLCGSTLTAVETVKVSQIAERVTYRCVCECGESDVTVKTGKIQSVTLRHPEKYPDFRILAG